MFFTKNKRSHKLWFLLGVLLLAVTLVGWLEKENKIITHNDAFPRFINPTSESQLQKGSRVRVEWTPLATKEGSAFLELLSESNTAPGKLKSHIQERTDASGKFTYITLPGDLDAKNTYQWCFFEGDVSPYAGGKGVRIFCSDQFLVLPSVSENQNNLSNPQFSLPTRGQILRRGQVAIIAWTNFSGKKNSDYYIIFVVPRAERLVEIMREKVLPEDGRWAVTVRENLEPSTRYLVCMYEMGNSKEVEGRKEFCSDPFTVE